LALEKFGRQQAFAAIEEALFPADSKQRLTENMNPSLRLQEKYEWIIGTEYLGNRAGDPNRARVQAKMATLPHPIERTMSFFAEAEASYLDLIKLHPSNADYKAEYAQLLVSRGSVERDNRSSDDARKDLNDAVDRLKQLVASHPTPRHEQLLARAYHEMAVLMSGEGKQDQLVAAESFYMLSRKIRQELVARYPGADGVEFRHELAMSDGWLGDLYLLLGEFAKARDSYQKSLSLRKALYDEEPDNWERSWQLARAYNNFLNIYGEYGDPKFTEGNDKQLELALDNAAKAHELQLAIVGESPANVDYRSDLGWTNNLMADILVDQGKSAEAAPLVFAAKKEFQELIRHDPDNRGYHSSLAWTYVILSKYHRQEGEVDESRAALKAAETELHNVTGQRGADGKQIENAELKSDSDFLTCALIHALRAKELTGTARNAEVRTALDELKQWANRGTQGSLRLERDTGLDELREEAEFKTLLEQLKQKWNGEAPRATG
jgi:tetratricopeptide (TPR) repeat protein